MKTKFKLCPTRRSSVNFSAKALISRVLYWILQVHNDNLVSNIKPRNEGGKNRLNNGVKKLTEPYYLFLFNFDDARETTVFYPFLPLHLICSNIIWDSIHIYG